MRDLATGLRSGLVFTRPWEDGDVDVAALAIRPGDRVLAVSGAGDVPLDLAACGASEVLAVDMSLPQLRLLALKIAAARTLDPALLHRLFVDGRFPGIGRVYRDELRPALAPADRAFWDRRVDLFRIGLHRSNSLGLATLVLRAWIDLPAPGRLRHDILTARDAAAQAAVYRRHYRRRIFNPVSRRLLHLGLEVLARGLNEDEAAAVRDWSFVAGLEARFAQRIQAHLVRSDPFWSETLLGSAASGATRHWLAAATEADVLRAAASRVVPVHGSVVDVLAAQPDASLDAIDLSNVPDWLPREVFDRVWADCARVLRPGGRVLYRSLAGGAVPRGAGLLQVDVARSDRLTNEESTGLYAAVVLARR